MAVVELVIKMLMVKRGGSALHEPTIDALMQSMADIGLINPLTVWRPQGMIPHVIAGRHRLEAAKRLGWEDIRCNVMEQMTEEPVAETIEIVENLHRRDIPKAEKDRLIRRYVELAERKKAVGVSGPLVPKPNAGRGGRPKGVASVVASQLGISKQGINRALARDKAREVGEIVGSSGRGRAEDHATEQAGRLSAAQCRAARALLDLTQPALAQSAGLGLSTIIDFEGSRRGVAAPSTLSIRVALENAGVEFIPANDGGGVGLRLRDRS